MWHLKALRFLKTIKIQLQSLVVIMDQFLIFSNIWKICELYWRSKKSQEIKTRRMLSLLNLYLNFENLKNN